MEWASVRGDPRCRDSAVEPGKGVLLIMFDLFALEGEELEKVLESLAESGIEVERDGRTILMSCE